MLLSALIEGAPSWEDLTADPVGSCGILLRCYIHVLRTLSTTVAQGFGSRSNPQVTAVVHEPFLNGGYDPVGADPSVGWSCCRFCSIVQVAVAAGTRAGTLTQEDQLTHTHG